jgi:mannan endo-1,4-beta-mannosidase
MVFLCLSSLVACSSTDELVSNETKGAGGPNAGASGSNFAGTMGNSGTSQGTGGQNSSGQGGGQSAGNAGQGTSTGGSSPGGSSGSGGSGGSGGSSGTSGSGGTSGTGGTGGTGGTTTATASNVSLRTKNTGQYLSVEEANSSVSAKAYSVGEKEIVTLWDINGGTLTDGDMVWLSGPSGTYFTAVGGGGGDLTVGTATPGMDQTFQLTRLAGSGEVANGDEVAFKASQMLEYMSAVDGGGGAVLVNQPHALAWETFVLGLNAKVMPPANAKEKVLSYLASQRGKKTLAGQHDKLNGTPTIANNAVVNITGKSPALYSADFGFGADSVDNRGKMIDVMIDQWNQGAVVQLLYHTCVPTGDEYCGWDDIGGAAPKHLNDSQWQEIVTNGTPLNNVWKQRLDGLSTHFAKLKAANVAPLFRPLHEMNQGVFWWGGRGGPEGTRKLFQITHDYLVNEKGFDNIIWVWDIQDFGSLAGDIPAYDPGKAYYDIVALDVYESGYTQQYYDLIKQAAGNKLMAIGECASVPSLDKLASQPDWSFFMLWPDFIDQNKSILPGVYASDRVLTRDELPGWK